VIPLEPDRLIAAIDLFLVFTTKGSVSLGTDSPRTGPATPRTLSLPWP